MHDEGTWSRGDGGQARAPGCRGLVAGGLLWLVAVVLGCGPGSPASSDAAADTIAQTDASEDTGPTCNYEFGRTYILDNLSILPEDEATVDIDGDGVPDDAMGFLGAMVNDGWKESIPGGSTLYIFDVVHWSDPPTPDDPDVKLVFYKGIDADSPPDPSNNLTGQGQFVVLAEQFDLSCKPTSGFDEGSLANRVLTANTARWTWVAPGVGTVEFVDVNTTWHFNEDFSRLDSDSLTGIWTICGLSRSLFPGPTAGTFLDVMVNGFGVQADIDRDGDGLEVVVYDPQGAITHCVDGDGVTEIPGKDCVCDPRVADGYSVAMKGGGVRATIVGVVETGS